MVVFFYSSGESTINQKFNNKIICPNGYKCENNQICIDYDEYLTLLSFSFSS